MTGTGFSGGEALLVLNRLVVGSSPQRRVRISHSSCLSVLIGPVDFGSVECLRTLRLRSARNYCG